MEIQINNEFLDRLFDGYLFDRNNPHWCITYKDRIITIGGKMFYKTRQQAVKAFYNTFRWRAGWIYRAVHHIDWRAYSNISDRMWKTFKDTIKNDFNVIQVH